MSLGVIILDLDSDKVHMALRQETLHWQFICEALIKWYIWVSEGTHVCSGIHVYVCEHMENRCHPRVLVCRFHPLWFWIYHWDNLQIKPWLTCQWAPRIVIFLPFQRWDHMWIAQHLTFSLGCCESNLEISCLHGKHFMRWTSHVAPKASLLNMKWIICE